MNASAMPGDSGRSEGTKPILNKSSLRLFNRSWSPEQGKRTKAAVVLVHGFSWHSGYFEELGQRLARCGYVVTAFDLQGHGRSESAQGIRGYARSFQDHVDDVEQVVKDIQEKHEGLPIYAFGESMGSLLLLLLSITEPGRQLLSGIIVSAPVTSVSESVLPPKFLLYILLFLAKFFPRLALPTSEIKDTHLTAFGDQETGRKSLEDPLVLFNPPTLGFVDQVLASTAHISKHFSQITEPILILHGQKDQRSSPQNSEDLYSSAGSTDKTIKRYPDGQHQLLQDKQDITQTVIKDIVAWLDARTSKA